MRGDYELLMRLREKDQAALEIAIQRYSRYVAAVVKKTMGPIGTEQDLEELVSDAFVALWVNAGKLRDNSDLKYWLAVVARNASLRRLKQLGRQIPLENERSFSRSLEEQVESEENQHLVRQAVDNMDPVDREIFLRHYFWHQPVAQIAEEMSKNIAAVKSRLSRGREKLRSVLVKEDRLL